MQKDRKMGMIGRRTFFSQMAMGTGLALTHWGCQSTPPLTSLRIGINDWIGFAIARYAKHSGLMKKRGLEIDLIEFMNLQDSTRAVLRGSLDATFSTTWGAGSGIFPNGNTKLMVATLTSPRLPTASLMR
jgi:NitT/TauT family transport system substrate-binding protein